MRAFLKPVVFIAAAVLHTSLLAAAVPFLGAPPPAPTPEEVARLPRSGIGKHGPTGPFTVNTASREEVRNFFNAVYAASEGSSTGWTGDLSTCAAGTTDAAFRDLVVLRINYFRAMAGVPAGLVLDGANNDKCQEAALMMSANDDLDHFPPPSWLCYTGAGSNAASNSNIAIGNAGPDAIAAYIDDFGFGNEPVGHRRWILYPQTKVMGTGDVPASPPYRSANATWVFDGNFGGPRPVTRTNFVSWPPPGFAPYQVVFARWSFSYPDANFTNASVTMTSNGVNVAVTKEPVEMYIGENTLVWHPTALSTAQPYAWPRPTADTVYSITVQNVVISGNTRSFTYSVTVFDPQTRRATNGGERNGRRSPQWKERRMA